VTEEAALGKRAEEVITIRTEDTGEPGESPIRRSLRTGHVVHLRKDSVLVDSAGKEKPVADSCSPIVAANGSITGAVIVFSDQSQERAARRELEEALAEKEILLRELYHRTKNNMNVIQSMISLRASQDPPPTVDDLVRETEHRIHTIGMVHEKLYQTHDLSGIDLGDYLKELANLLYDAYDMSAKRVRIDVKAEPVPVLIDTAVPCGLLANELISNSFKHAFPDDSGGEVEVSLRRVDDSISLDVSDSGTGLPKETNPRKINSLGMQTIILLAEHQLQGTISFNTDRGFHAHVEFPHEVYSRRV
jgi:two-component sensor histidine kinase